MAEQQAFDPQAFLAKVGAGRTVVPYPKQRPEGVFHADSGTYLLEHPIGDLCRPLWYRQGITFFPL